MVDQVPAVNCTALSAGTNPLFSAGEAVDHDQRGNPRPNNDNCDIGAREYTSLTVSSALDSVQEDGLCTLREAVSTANSGVPSGNAPGECQLIPDALEIPAGTYTLSIVGAQEDENLTGDLDLQVDLTLNGAGAENTIIQAGQDAESAIDRVLDIHRSAQINALTIAHGSASSLPTDDGGGISHGGGGLFVLADSVIRDNIAEGQGGGLSISADYSYITNSAIIGNQSKTHVGGGLFLFGSHHTIANSTVSQNQAADDGGGVYLKGTDLYLTHVTITDNVSDSDNNGSGDGGGLFSENKLTLISTIIAGNDDIGGEKPDLAGTSALASRDYNLIGNIGSQSFTAQNNDIVGTNSSPVDPELDNLTGDVPYHLPSLDSPVIDTIPAASCTYTTHQENPYFSDGELVTHDQRGRPRPADSDMDGSAACEIGAIEVFEPPTSLYLPLVLME